MTAPDPAVATLVLLLGFPVGAALTGGLPPARSRIARAGSATLAGLGAVAGIAHALMALAVPARVSVPVLAGLGIATAISALARRRREARRSADADRRAAGAPAGVRECVLLEAGPLVVVLLLLLTPFRIAHNFGITEHDAIRIWAPKAARAFDEAPPSFEPDSGHAHPEYPRGLGILTAAPAAAAGELDARLPRMVPLLLFGAALLAAFDALSARGNVRGAWAAILILGTMPVVVRHATSGLADLPLAGFILLGGAALAHGRAGRPAVLAALSGGAGALVTKDEGLVFLGALTALLAFRLIRCGAWRTALAAIGAAALLVAPWAALRSQVHGEPFLWRSSPQNAGLLLMRFDSMIRELGHLVLGLPDPSPGGFSLPDIVPGRDAAVLTALACAIALALVPRRRGGFPAVLVGVLLLADFVAILFSTVGIDWQLVTAYNRLVLQGLPLLLVATIDRLTTPPAAPDAAAARAASAA